MPPAGDLAAHLRPEAGVFAQGDLDVLLDRQR
jgi:hypothetical protein